MTPSPSAPPDARRWAMLAVIALGFVAMTFNWFVMPVTFAGVGEDFSAGVAALSLLVAVFVVGYGVMHIPAGFLATRYGLRLTLVAGLALEGVLTATAGLVDDYAVLLVLRALAGLAASVYAGIGIAAVSVWFRGRELAFALGVVSASFSVGVAVGLEVWGSVVAATGWRTALVLAGLVAVVVAGIVAAVYRAPAGDATLAGTRLSGAEVRAVLANPRLWRAGLAFFGGYGAFFAASQLVGTYATADRGFDAATAALAALLVGLAGVPGSLVAGWVSDRLRSRHGVFAAFLVLQALGTALVPLAGASWLWSAAALVGFGFNGAFAVWQTTPAEDPGVAPAHIGTAVGLMLTITAVGGFGVPWVFGLLAEGVGFGVAWVFLAVVSLVFLPVLPRRAVRAARVEAGEPAVA